MFGGSSQKICSRKAQTPDVNDFTSLFLAGSFMRTDPGYVPSLNRACRLNSDGSLDNTFSVGTGFSNTVDFVKIQNDGKMLFAGLFTTYNSLTASRVVRLNTNGSIDATFVTGTGFNNTTRRLDIQNDGKIIYVGAFTSYNGTAINRIARLNSDGSLDSSFVVGTGFNGEVRHVKVQSDGKIVCGGSFTSYNGTTVNRIVRLNSDGSLDTSFNSGSGFNSTVVSLDLDSNNKILCGGQFTNYNTVNINRVARLNSDGSLDTTFAVGLGIGDTVMEVKVDRNDKVLCGFFGTTANGLTANRLVRLNNDGSIDSQFLTNIGTACEFPSGARVYAFAIQSDNKILLVHISNLFNNYLQPFITRLNEDGTIDTTFNINKTVFWVDAQTLAIQNDGKIVCAGLFTTYGTFNPRLVCLNNNIEKAVNIVGFDDIINDLVLQNDGKLVAVGQFTSYNNITRSRVVRINADLSIDSSFVVGTGLNATAFGVAVQSDGKVIVVGNFTNYNGTARNRIVRLNTNGSIDNTFNIGTGFDSEQYVLAIQSDGKILCAGGATTYNGVSANRIVRLNTDGSRDTSFVIGTGFNSSVSSMAIQSDGKILCGGNFTSYNGTASNRIIRLNSDGSIDSTFNIGTGASSGVSAIAIQSDNKIVIGGLFTSYNGFSINRIARLNSDGTRDTSFVVGSGFSASVLSMVVESDGKIFVGGSFTSYNGVTRYRFARLYSNGTLDPTVNFSCENQVKKILLI